MGAKPVVIVLHGPSGVGKDSVIDAVRKRTGIHRPTSSTDRPRDPKKDHPDAYHWLSTREFETKIAKDEFIEYAIVYNQWKGVERREVEPLIEQGRDFIIRTNVDGARAWRKKVEGAVFVFLDAEDETELWERLKGRGRDPEPDLIIRRTELAAELADRPNNDYVVVNRKDRLEDTVDELVAIIERERSNPSRPLPALRES